MEAIVSKSIAKRSLIVAPILALVFGILQGWQGAVAALVGRLEPDLVVWVDQPYGYTTSVGGSDDVFEQAWSAGSGLPVRADVTQHGGGESWAHFGAGLDSMLIEIDTWAATPEIVAAQRSGFEAALAALG